MDKIKPWHVMAAGPSLALLGIVVSLLLAPYVELHSAHRLLVGILLCVVGLVPIGLVPMLSDSPGQWNKDLDL